jgi:glycogen phosphorylase
MLVDDAEAHRDLDEKRMSAEFIHIPRTAYFSMEIALRSEIPTYAGGLGVLAGDTVRTAADLDLPFVAVSLVSRLGNFRQTLDDVGRQCEQPQPWEPSRFATPLQARVCVQIEGRDVWVGGWLYVVQGHSGRRQPVILLDTDLPDNAPEDRELTHHLYGGDARYRLCQEIVLGIGGVRMLDALGFEIRQFHLNEGHSALLALQLLRRYEYSRDDVRSEEIPYDVHRVRALCNFTTHTPVDAGHDRFSYDLVWKLLGDFIDRAVLVRLAGEHELNMTRLALNLSEFVNGVAVRHAEVSRRMFPGYRVTAVTNGVHAPTWVSPALAGLYDRYLPQWRHEPEILVRADCCIPSGALREAHARAKLALFSEVAARSGVMLDPSCCTLGYARRMTAYKRPDLLFSDMARLRAIARQRPIQVVLAGKAHPQDAPGKRLIEQLHGYMSDLRGAITLAYLPDYDMALAGHMVAGVDVWLNTPLPPFEASGTSGM